MMTSDPTPAMGTVGKRVFGFLQAGSAVLDVRQALEVEGGAPPPAARVCTLCCSIPPRPLLPYTFQACPQHTNERPPVCGNHMPLCHGWQPSIKVYILCVYLCIHVPKEDGRYAHCSACKHAPCRLDIAIQIVRRLSSPSTSQLTVLKEVTEQYLPRSGMRQYSMKCQETPLQYKSFAFRNRFWDGMQCNMQCVYVRL